MVVTIPSDAQLILPGLLAIPLIFVARGFSVLAPPGVMRTLLPLGRLARVTLIWGGMRGGVSIALALGLPDSPERAYILAVAYIAALFSVIVQGGTIGRAIR